MNEFKGRHYQGLIILGCVRWYCKYGISYRDLEEMMLERGVEVDHTTLYRWIQHYAPLLEKKLRPYFRPSFSSSWRVDETYIRVKGKWVYLYRAVNKHGKTIDFYLSTTRNTKAAKRFLGKAMKSLAQASYPYAINTDKAPTYGRAIAMLKKEGKCPETVIHRQVKYLNNIVESDHGKLKRLIKPTLGFKSMKTAYATIKGFEVMRMFKKRQFIPWMYDKNVVGEVRLINEMFEIYSV